MINGPSTHVLQELKSIFATCVELLAAQLCSQCCATFKDSSIPASQHTDRALLVKDCPLHCFF